MAAVSYRPPSCRNDLCYECHSWVIQHLTKEHALARCDTRDDFLFEVEVQVGRCDAHAVTCTERFINFFPRIFFDRPLQVHRLYFTKSEVDVMRRAGGSALYAGAPASTTDSNLHFATYRLDKKDRKGDSISCAAVDHLFGYIAATISQGMVANRWCCCFRTHKPGLRHCVPIKEPPHVAHKRERQVGATSAANPWTPEVCAAYESEDSDEEVSTPVDCHTVVSKVPGVELCHDRNEPADSPPLAVRILPRVENRVFWMNSQRNINMAVRQRIEQPFVPMTMSDAERAELSAVGAVLIEEFKKDKKLIDKIIQDKTGLSLWRSKKWTPKRAERALHDLRATYAPKYRFEAGIKLEPSKTSKPPRLLVADGDRGQVMAWVVIGTLEAWIFKRWRHRSIKGLPKSEAMQRVAQSLRQKDPRAAADSPDIPAAIVENDGSAWDACMSDTLRDLVENPIMAAIGEAVQAYFLVESPPDFINARLASNKMTELNLGFRKGKGADDPIGTCDLPKNKSWQLTIRAIRRSGCRGTSCLNFVANMTCWAWAIGGSEACKLVRPQGSRVLCVDGIVRFVKMVFEGDDSILSFVTLDAAGKPAEAQLTREFMHTLGLRWTSMGHRPKLHWRRPDQVAEFTGWHFAVDEHGIDGDVAAPDLFRNLTNMAFSLNKGAIAAAISGDSRALNAAVAPGVISRMYPMADRFPQLCRIIAGRFGRHMRDTSEIELTRDEIYALELEPEDFGFKESEEASDMDLVIERATHRFQPIYKRFETAMGRGNDQAEATLATRLGIVPDDTAYFDLLDAVEGGFMVGAEEEKFGDDVASLRGL